MPTVTFVNTDKSPALGIFRPVCLEFLQGFTDYGFTVTETTNLEHFHTNDIVLMSNNHIDIEYLKLLNKLNPDAIYILWFYHRVVDSIPFKNYILTSEMYVYEPKLDEHVRAHKINTSRIFCPLALRANEDPKKIGLYEKQPKLLASFIGTGYKREWVDDSEILYYHDINHRGLLTSEQRREIYLNSIFCLGFHSDGNITNSHVVQRVFEGLSYGCVVLSDNKAASDLTNGIVEYVQSREEVYAKMQYFIKNPQDIIKKQIAGYEWSKKYGTNRYSAKLFLDTIKTHWNRDYITGSE
jgi:hypothetical protein